MSRPEVHEIDGTTFRFPELPPHNEVDPALFASLRNKRKAILAEASNPRVPIRNVGTVGAVLGKMAGPARRFPSMPGGLTGCAASVMIDGRKLSFWASGPRAGQSWFVDTDTREYVLVHGERLGEFVVAA
jgi:hypothetical protein